jgi:uncharacterized DUF497 family protein
LSSRPNSKVREVGQVIRIISACRATKREGAFYARDKP